MTPDKQLTTTKQEVGFTPTEENIQLLKTTLTGAGTVLTDNELRLFLYQAKQTGLDPLAKQIYVMKSGGKLTFMTSIDGQRLVAQRTGQYEGQVGPQWCGKDGNWRDVWLADESPAAARVGVYRTGFREPVYGVATWKSYAKPNSQTWRQLGDVMLAKCAEALAFRKGFPQELSGIYTSEEMDQVHTPEPISRENPDPMPYIDEMPGAEAQVEAVFTPNPITEPQIRKIYATFNAKGIKGPDQKRVLIGLAKTHLGLEITSGKELSKEDAMSLIDHLEKQDPQALQLFFGGDGE